jgi:hypothetical protein
MDAIIQLQNQTGNELRKLLRREENKSKTPKKDFKKVLKKA